MAPDLLPNEVTPPCGSKDIRNGYILLHAKERYLQAIDGAEGQAIVDLYAQKEGTVPENLQVTRWAQLWLPNGQIAQSAWKESRLSEPHIAHMVKLKVDPLWYNTL